DYKELVDGTKYPNPCPTLPTPPKTPLPTSPVLPKRGMGRICLELGGNSGITVIVTDNGRRVESESWNVAATDQITQGAVGDSNIEQGEDVGLIEIASQLWTDAVRQNSLRDDTSSKFASVDGFVYRKIFSTSEILQLISCLF
ncbi:unnamed protein product, partial [Fusarium graminearum]